MTLNHIINAYQFSVANTIYRIPVVIPILLVRKHRQVQVMYFLLMLFGRMLQYDLSF